MLPTRRKCHQAYGAVRLAQAEGDEEADGLGEPAGRAEAAKGEEREEGRAADSSRNEGVDGQGLPPQRWRRNGAVSLRPALHHFQILQIRQAPGWRQADGS